MLASLFWISVASEPSIHHLSLCDPPSGWRSSLKCQIMLPFSSGSFAEILFFFPSFSSMPRKRILSFTAWALAVVFIQPGCCLRPAKWIISLATLYHTPPGTLSTSPLVGNGPKQAGKEVSNIHSSLCQIFSKVWGERLWAPGSKVKRKIICMGRRVLKLREQRGWRGHKRAWWEWPGCCIRPRLDTVLADMASFPRTEPFFFQKNLLIRGHISHCLGTLMSLRRNQEWKNKADKHFWNCNASILERSRKSLESFLHALFF